jgi:regulator of cell morphogenesis and NO signaling
LFFRNDATAAAAGGWLMGAADLLQSVIADLLAAKPAAVRVLAGLGMRCAGCTFARFETVAEAAGAYGIDPLVLAGALDAPPAAIPAGELTMSITDATTIAEIATACPASVRVFQRYGIDFCCGGKRPLRSACADQGIPFEELARALGEAAAAPAPDTRDWSRQPLHTLIDHIIGTYHDALRDELPRLGAMAAKVAAVHGRKSPALRHIDEVLGALSADLGEHMHKEERALFPAIRSAEAGLAGAAAVAHPIAVLEHEHDDAGVLLAELRSLTDGFAVPDWGCGTMRALYDGLAALEAAMHVHVHLENNVLFPRALRLAGAAPDGSDQPSAIATRA